MTDRKERAPCAFRLNFEQQKNRAKDLLRAAHAGDPAAGTRLTAVADADAFKLAHAQLAIARELRFVSWAKLKAHIKAMDRERTAIDADRGAPDTEIYSRVHPPGGGMMQSESQSGVSGDARERAGAGVPASVSCVHLRATRKIVPLASRCSTRARTRRAGSGLCRRERVCAQCSRPDG